MVKLSFYDRVQPPARALAWLVDDHGGTATVREIATAIFGPKPKHSRAMAGYIGPMCKAGWVAVQDGFDGKITTSAVTVTPSGYLWRDYFRLGRPEYVFNRLEDHAYRRAFELALEPLAKAGVRYRESSPAKQEQLRYAMEGCGIGPLQALIAAELLFPSGEISVIYPWTPGWLSRRSSAHLVKLKPDAIKPGRRTTARGDKRRDDADGARDSNRRRVSRGAKANQERSGAVVDGGAER